MRLRVGTEVAAPPEVVYAVYAGYPNWPAIFPTIHAVSRVGVDGAGIVIAVDHDEGRVRNVLWLRPPDRIILAEDKHQYDATFVNTFRPSGTGTGTRFEVDGRIRLKGLRRLLSPVLRPRARRLIENLQLAPVRAEAERLSGEPGPGPADG